MSPSTHRPEPGAPDAARPAHRLVPAGPEALEGRLSTSITGITEQVLFPGGPARPGGLRPVEVSGVILTDGPARPSATALLYDGDSPEVPASFVVPLVAAGEGRYTYSLPLTLTSGHATGPRRGHRYAVAITAQDPTSSAGTTANFTLMPPKPRPVPTARPRPAGLRR